MKEIDQYLQAFNPVDPQPTSDELSETEAYEQAFKSEYRGKGKRTGTKGNYKYEYDTPAGKHYGVRTKDGRDIIVPSRGAAQAMEQNKAKLAQALVNARPGEGIGYSRVREMATKFGVDKDTAEGVLRSLVDKGHMSELASDMNAKYPKSDKTKVFFPKGSDGLKPEERAAIAGGAEKGAKDHHGLMMRMKPGESVVDNVEAVAKHHKTTPEAIREVWDNMEAAGQIKYQGDQVVRTAVDYGVDPSGPRGRSTKRDAGGRESLDFAGTEANARNMSDKELDGAIQDALATLKSADEMDRANNTDRGGLYRDEISVYRAEKKRRATEASKAAKKTKINSASRSNVKGVGIAKTADGRVIAYPLGAKKKGSSEVTGPTVEVKGGGKHSFQIGSQTYDAASRASIGITDEQVLSVNNALIEAKKLSPDYKDPEAEFTNQDTEKSMSEINQYEDIFKGVDIDASCARPNRMPKGGKTMEPGPEDGGPLAGKGKRKKKKKKEKETDCDPAPASVQQSLGTDAESHAAMGHTDGESIQLKSMRKIALHETMERHEAARQMEIRKSMMPRDVRFIGGPDPLKKSDQKPAAPKVRVARKGILTTTQGPSDQAVASLLKSMDEGRFNMGGETTVSSVSEGADLVTKAPVQKNRDIKLV